MHLCEQCNRRFDSDEPVMLINTGKGIYLFCSVRCRDKNRRLPGTDRRSEEDRRNSVHSQYSGSDRRKRKDRRVGKDRRVYPERYLLS